MQIDYSKYADGLVPAIVQDNQTKIVLMLGFMNKAAVEKSIETGKVTFYSRSKQRLWTKGEQSGNFLSMTEIVVDCDNDTLLIKATPHGPTCHTGADTCFGEKNDSLFFTQLENIIQERMTGTDEKSYVKGLMKKGINKVAQKVGEEAVELVIEAKDNNDGLFLDEAADLFFHYCILLKAKGFSLQQVSDILKARHDKAI